MILYLAGIVVCFFITMTFFSSFFEYCVRGKKTFLTLGIPTKKSVPEALVISLGISAIVSLLWPLALLFVVSYNMFETRFKRPFKIQREIYVPLEIMVFVANDGTKEYVRIEPEMLADMHTDDTLYASHINIMLNEIKEKYPEASYDEMATRIIDHLDRLED